MFYDNFTSDQICGIFTKWHFVAIGVFVVTMIIALYLSRNFTQEKVKKMLVFNAILVTIMELIKIVIRLIRGTNINGWVPLYFCSLFIFASLFGISKNKFIRNMGYCFMVCGGIIASACYTIYPTTSLLLYPIWHPASLHSLFYHWIMFYTGVMLLVKGIYTPKARDFGYYFAFTTIFTALAVIINLATGSNLMLISQPFGIEILQAMYDISPIFYGLSVYIAQSVLLFWAIYGIYKLALLIIGKRHNTNKPNLDEDEEPHLTET